MKHVCMVCGTVYCEDLCPPLDGESHGACPACSEVFIEEARAFAASSDVFSERQVIARAVSPASPAPTDDHARLERVNHDPPNFLPAVPTLSSSTFS